MPTSQDAPVLTYVNRFLGGSLLGAQLVWSIAVLPTYEKLDNDEYLKVHTLLTWYGDALMPSLGLSSTISGFLRYRRTGEATALVGSLALTAASIAAARNLRINTRMRELRAARPTVAGDDDLQPTVDHERGMWAAQHLIRTTGGLVAASAFLLPKSPRFIAGRPKGKAVGVIDLPIALIALRSMKEIGGHFAMMRGKGKNAGMGRSLGVVQGEAAAATQERRAS